VRLLERRDRERHGAELPDGCVPTGVTPKGMAFTKTDTFFSNT